MHPTIVLSNGLRIANFSSSHEFKFVTGEVLAACDPSVSRELMLDAVEETFESACGRFQDIVLEFRMNSVVGRALIELADRSEIDIILVPLPVQMALKAAAELQPELWVSAVRKARCIRVADRVSKTIHHDRFCR